MICRSGAITVAEISAAGVAAILFPLPWFVADEQSANAAFLADRGAGIAMKQLETTPESLAALLRSLTRGKLAAMAAAARGLGKPDATRRCADLCMEVARAA
jgi:UDP-N-acetylglucosamine--N-acetylmuramyl-(pentapeptide) pyrophosphoryl-undecaprenol N-acetylglucosamine transferase